MDRDRDTRSLNIRCPDQRLIDGYDYKNQAWVKSGKYLRCGHPDNVDCRCYGREHEGEETR